MRSSAEEALQKLTASPGALFVKIMEHGSMYVEIYKPYQTDKQTPHLQDELYVVITGTGDFVNNGVRSAFKPGDILFAPAGIDHHFANFTEDFVTWVIFYGPVGGERGKVKGKRLKVKGERGKGKGGKEPVFLKL